MKTIYAAIIVFILSFNFVDAQSCTEGSKLRLLGTKGSGNYQQLTVTNLYPNVGIPNQIEIYSGAWTCSSQGVPACNFRALLRYNLDYIPTTTTILSAKLYLYARPNSTNALVGSPTYGSANACYLQQIISPWDTTGVNTSWNHLPNVLTTNEKTLPQSTSTVQDYTVDVTDFVQAWVNKPDSNYGMMLKLINEASYNSMIFHSGTSPDAVKPKLEICYSTVIHFPKIQGYLFTDLNGNGILDAGEQFKANTRVELSNGLFTFTDTSGHYELTTDALGSFDVSAIAPAHYMASPATTNYYFTAFDTTVTTNIAIQPTDPADSLTINLTPLLRTPRPGFRYPVYVQYENVGNTALTTAIDFSNNGKLKFDSCSNALVTHVGDSLDLTQSTLQPSDYNVYIAYFTVKPTALLGDTVKLYSTIAGGNALAADSFQQRISGSYDPNDIEATPSLTTSQLHEGKYINYTIRFENTGTDTAFNILVADTLSSLLQANTLQVTGSSHKCKSTVEGNRVKFEFKNILLPDSNRNKIKCYGFVSFKVKPLSNLAATTNIPGQASIYFDFNKPVVTNTALTKITSDSLPITGNIITPVNKGVTNAVVYLNGTNSSTNNSILGKYSFSAKTGGNYTIKPKKNNDVVKNNGVSSIDIIQIQNHILNKTPFTHPFKLIAADVNNDKKVSSIDLIFMKRVILGIDTTFTGNRLWAFVDSAYTFSNPANPFPYKDSINITGLSATKNNQTFIALKLGDVDYSWNAAVAKQSKPNNTPVELYYDVISTEEKSHQTDIYGTNPQGLVKLPIRVQHFKEMLAMQYTLNFNSEAYDYVGIENNLLKMDFNDKPSATNDGHISFLWNDANSNYKTLEDGTLLFELILKPKNNKPSAINDGLSLSSDITSIEAYDKDMIKHDIILSKGQQSIVKDIIIYPNPAKETVNIAGKNIKTLKIVDNMGRIKLTKNYVQSISNTTINIHSLPKGIYSVQVLNTSGVLMTEKLVVE